MHSFEVHSNESACRKKSVLGWNKSVTVRSLANLPGCKTPPFPFHKQIGLPHAIFLSGRGLRRFNCVAPRFESREISPGNI